MVNWQDPAVVAFCAYLYNQDAVFLLGFFGYHFVTRMTIEWSLLKRKRRFSSALIPYLFGRYAILATLLFFVISNRFKHKISCDVAYKILALLGSSASFCSTLNLGLRSYIIWRDMNRIVVWVLSFACVGHAALVVVQGAQSVSSQWDPFTESCIVVRSSNISMFIFYLYTTLMDLAVLILTVCGLWRKAALRSNIGTSLSEQCLWYCVATFLVNIPAAVFPILNLNVIMNVIISMPATTVSVIMSSAAVLSLEPEEYYGSPSDAMRERGRHRNTLSVDVHGTRPRRVTLTTNIVLTSQIDSGLVDDPFEAGVPPRKSTETAPDAAAAV
ncbi:hypothetical protein C8Q77DRAFT_558072 [Trametes polyzona]|nr:hypothetical protein C8Q77DRAFT_558072 [Trametes polyzona]